MLIEELREFREQLYESILSQASKEEGATTIPRGSRVQVDSKRATPEKVMI
jgi:hypothetical protein